MAMHLFRNWYYRTYFQFLDAFAQPHCSLCVLLADNESDGLRAILKIRDAESDIAAALGALCSAHILRLRIMVSDHSALLPALKASINASLRELARSRSAIAAGRRSQLAPPRRGCRVCRHLITTERNLSRALSRFLEDTEFWNGFAKAPLLCLHHLRHALAAATEGAGCDRLIADQKEKLNALLNELVRHQATGNRDEALTAAVNWLSNNAAPAFDGSASANTGELTVDRSELDKATPLDGPGEEALGNEELVFENERLRRKVEDLLSRLSGVESRAASLHFQLSNLTEANQRLEMGYTGANAQAEGLKQLVWDLRQRIRELESGGKAEHTKSDSANVAVRGKTDHGR